MTIVELFVFTIKKICDIRRKPEDIAKETEKLNTVVSDIIQGRPGYFKKIVQYNMEAKGLPIPPELFKQEREKK